MFDDQQTPSVPVMMILLHDIITISPGLDPLERKGGQLKKVEKGRRAQSKGQRTKGKGQRVNHHSFTIFQQPLTISQQ